MWLLAMCLLLSGPVFSQEPVELVTVTGRAVNSEDGSGVPKGTLSIFGRAGGVYNLGIRDGKFSGEIPAADGYRMQTWAPGFAELRLTDISVYPNMAPLTLKFLPTRATTGRVVDPEGRGIPGVSVGLAFDPEGKQIQMGAVSDDEGYFRMDFASDPRVFYLVPSKGGYQSIPPVPFDYPAQSELLIELSPRAAGETGSIVGVARMGGQPLQGQEVWLTRSDGLVFQRFELDSKGEFHFSDLNPGEYSLSLRRGGRDHAKLAERNVSVAAGGPIQVEFALPGGRMSGVVVNLAGEPVHNAVVGLDAGMTESEPLADTPEERDATRRRGLRKPVVHSATTNTQGGFEFVGVEPGPYRLIAHSRSYLPLAMSVEVPADDGVRVVLEPGVDLRGVLVDRDGQVIESFHYSIDPLQGGSGGHSAPISSVQGLFLIQGLRPALYSFEVYLSDGREATGIIDLSLGTDVLLQMPTKEGEELVVRYER